MKIILSLLCFAGIALAAGDEKTVTEKYVDRNLASVLTKRVFSLTASNATAEAVVRMIGQKAGIPVQIDGDLTQRVTYNFADTTLENALQEIATDVGFEYNVRNDVLYVSKIGANQAGANQSAHLIELKFTDADEMANRLKTFVKTGESVHVDKKLNSLVFVGSDASFAKAKTFVDLFDRMPQQILIEAKIVETNDNFSREIGFLAGDQGASPLDMNTKANGYSSPQFANTPVLGMKYQLGKIASRSLDIRLLAAETRGDAKVVSRPKVVTINNTRALINSGLTLSVKTLSTVQTGAGSTTSATTTSSGSTVAGGLEKVEAGLQLGVLPSVVNTDMVRLVVDVNNSQPDSQIAVDGIPAVSTNSANTSVIVENGATAVIAGLIKNANSNSRSGVPFLSDIPILGLLFRSDAKVTKNNEMIILITPRIIQKQVDGPVNAENEQEKPAAKN